MRQLADIITLPIYLLTFPAEWLAHSVMFCFKTINYTRYEIKKFNKRRMAARKNRMESVCGRAEWREVQNKLGYRMESI
jgi:hypothetical protein